MHRAGRSQDWRLLFRAEHATRTHPNAVEVVSLRFFHSFFFHSLKGVFSPNPLFLRTCPAHPIRAHTCSAITQRLCGWLGASCTHDLGALRLWQSCRQWRAQPWSCMDAAPGCRLQRRSSANTLTAWPGRVAQAPRAGRARTPWSSSPCWRPSSRTARFGDQLGIDDEANWEIADGSATGSRLRGGTSVGDLPTSSVSAVQLVPVAEKACFWTLEQTHPV